MIDFNDFKLFQEIKVRMVTFDLKTELNVMI